MMVALKVTRSTSAHQDADILIQSGDAAAWPRVLRILGSVPALGAPLLTKRAHAAVFGTWLAGTEDVSSRDLARLFALLADHNLGATPLPTGTSGFARLGANELRTLRYALLQVLASRRAPHTIEILTELAARDPQDSLVSDALERGLDLSWIPVTSVADLVKATTNPINRLANDQ
jgi:hypothetical protein